MRLSLPLAGASSQRELSVLQLEVTMPLEWG